VSAGNGLLIREAGTDGRTYYNILNGGTVTQALVAVGPSVRVTSDPANFVGDPGLLADMGLTQPLAPSSFASGQSSLAGSASGFSIFSARSSDPVVGSQVSSYLAGGSSMVAPDLLLSQRLLSDADLSFATGQPADVDSGVDWWLESVAL
jgi:hypothetical protein